MAVAFRTASLRRTVLLQTSTRPTSLCFYSCTFGLRTRLCKLGSLGPLHTYFYYCSILQNCYILLVSFFLILIQQPAIKTDGFVGNIQNLTASVAGMRHCCIRIKVNSLFEYTLPTIYYFRKFMQKGRIILLEIFASNFV